MDKQEGQHNKVIDEKFKDELLYKLDGLRKANFLCDTTVRAEGQDFSVHSCVLSAASDYFKALFASELRVKENQSSLVELTEIKSTIMAEVLQFIYTGKTNINSCNAQDLVKASDYLIVPSLKSKAAQFLEKSINASDCLALESFAFQYNCDSLKQTAIKYKRQHFVDVVKSEEFLSLDLEKVKELMCEDDLNISEEEQVYEAVMSWVKNDLSDRECFLPALLKCLRLFSMFKYSLQMFLDTEKLIAKNPICSEILNRGLQFFLFPDRFLGVSLKHRTSVKKDEHVVVLNEYFTRKLFCFVPATKKWQPLARFPNFCHPLLSTAVCGGHLYAISTSLLVSIFDPKKNVWSSEENLDAPFDEANAVSSYNEELYFTGCTGSYRESHAVSNQDVYKYNPNCNKWKQLASMKTGRAFHCQVVLKDLIYVIGGESHQVCLKSVERYNPSTNHWQKVPNMANARMCAAAASAHGKIVVVGGFADDNRSRLEPSCEVFDPNLNQWSLVSSPTIPRGTCATVGVDDTVYVFGNGGRMDDDDHVVFDEIVECFEVKCNEWHKVDTTVPSPIYACGATLLRVPKMCMNS